MINDPYLELQLISFTQIIHLNPPSSTNNKMAAIVDLLQELLLIIASHLGTADYGHLRRTCSAIEKTLFEDFAKHFFTTRQFMLIYAYIFEPSGSD